MGTTLGGVDCICEGIYRFGICRVPLHGDFSAHAFVFGFSFNIDHTRIRNAFAGIDVAHKIGDTTFVAVAHATHLLNVVIVFGINYNQHSLIG